MNGWFLIIWASLMLAWGAAGIAAAVTDWQASGYAASTHDDPSVGSNPLF